MLEKMFLHATEENKARTKFDRFIFLKRILSKFLGSTLKDFFVKQTTVKFRSKAFAKVLLST